MARITNGTFPGPVGQLEYILNEDGGLGPAAAAPSRAAVICHPHPLHRGTMHTKIVYQAAKAIAEMGLPVLRFHFRGVGKSQGNHDHGVGEQDDLAAAVGFLQARYPLPIVVAGFSFGSTVVAKWLAAAPRPAIAAAVLLGTPVSAYAINRGPLPTAWAWQGPKLMISGDRDSFANVPALEAFFAALAEPKSRHWIAGADHFLTGHQDEFRSELQRWLQASRD